MSIQHRGTMACLWRYVIAFLCIINTTVILAETEQEPLEQPKTEGASESPSTKPEEAPAVTEGEDPEKEHAVGSVCSYCSYCKFCKLCDADCPCTKSKFKPNCHMCKYCKYCYLCSAICDTVCVPGGILDTVSSKLWNSLPSFDSKMKDAVDQDLDSVKDWIKEYL